MFEIPVLVQRTVEKSKNYAFVKLSTERIVVVIQCNGEFNDRVGSALRMFGKCIVFVALSDFIVSSCYASKIFYQCLVRSCLISVKNYFFRFKVGHVQ